MGVLLDMCGQCFRSWSFRKDLEALFFVFPIIGLMIVVLDVVHPPPLHRYTFFVVHNARLVHLTLIPF